MSDYTTEFQGLASCTWVEEIATKFVNSHEHYAFRTLSVNQFIYVKLLVWIKKWYREYICYGSPGGRFDLITFKISVDLFRIWESGKHKFSEKLLYHNKSSQITNSSGVFWEWFLDRQRFQLAHCMNLFNIRCLFLVSGYFSSTVCL